MKREFVNKTVCFFGDSITEHGHYIYNLRAFFAKKEEKIYVYNRGTGGARAITAKYVFHDEVKELNPDYVVICFGVNDLGIWLYDGNKKITDEIIKKREQRNDEYFSNIGILVDMIKSYGAKPIIMSPFPVDEFIAEKENIETLADNEEKETYIGPAFYKRTTFRNINFALKEYALGLKQIAKELDVPYIPLFESIHSLLGTEVGLFWKDGIHCSHKGHELIAKVVLTFFGCEQEILHFEKTMQNDEIYTLEQIERKAGFLLRNTFNRYNGEFMEADIRNKAKELLLAEEEWLREVGRYYLEYNDKISDLRLKIMDLTHHF